MFWQSGNPAIRSLIWKSGKLYAEEYWMDEADAPYAGTGISAIQCGSDGTDKRIGGTCGADGKRWSLENQHEIQRIPFSRLGHPGAGAP